MKEYIDVIFYFSPMNTIFNYLCRKLLYVYSIHIIYNANKHNLKHHKVNLILQKDKFIKKSLLLNFNYIFLQASSQHDLL